MSSNSSAKNPGPPRDLADRLYSAAEDGDLKELESLIDEWAARNEDPPNDFTPDNLKFVLFRAIHAEKLSSTHFLLQRGPSVEDYQVSGDVLQSDPGVKPDMYQLLLNYGWNINNMASSGWPLLMHALTNPPLLTWALEHGADPNTCSDFGYNSLDQAAGHSDLSVVQLLVRHGGRLERSLALHAACRGEQGPERIKVLSFLLDSGKCNVNGFMRRIRAIRPQTPVGTPLWTAIGSRYMEAIKLLLSRGADAMSVCNSRGETPLEAARVVGYTEIVPMLEDARMLQTLGERFGSRPWQG